MDDIQFEILDELYFVISFEDLSSNLDFEREILLSNLIDMVKKGWVKCFEKETELAINDVKFTEDKFIGYFFLATKKGLFAHNTT